MRKSIILALVALAAAAGVLVWLYAAQPADWGVVVDYEVDVEAGLRSRAEETASQLIAHPPWGDADCAVTPVGPTIRVACATDVTLESAPEDYALFPSALGSFELRMQPPAIKKYRVDAMRHAVATLQRRLEAAGISGARTRLAGAESMSVFIPETRAAELAPTKIDQVGQLRFQIVDQAGSAAFFARIADRAQQLTDWPDALDPALKRHTVVATETGVRSTSRAVLEYLIAGQSDAQHRVGFEAIVVDPQDADLKHIRHLSPRYKAQLGAPGVPTLNADVSHGYKLVYVFRGRGLGGQSLEDAAVGLDQFDRPLVNLRFNQSAADAFFQLTHANVNALMAIMVDDVVYSAPRIKTGIAGGRVQISIGTLGDDGIRQAEELVAVLKSGTLIAPLRKVGTRDVQKIAW